MVLFDEDPVTLIRQTTQNFHTTSDLSCLSRITTSLSTLRSARSLRLQSTAHALSATTRTTQHAQNTLSTTLSRHDPAAHASLILDLDTEKFRVAKQCSDLEVEGERLAGELRGLRAQSAGLDDEEEVGTRKGEEDERVLRLKVYRALGIEAEIDEGTGEVKRAVVRGRGARDVNVVHMDRGEKFDRFFYAGLFWGSL